MRISYVIPTVLAAVIAVVGVTLVAQAEEVVEPTLASLQEQINELKAEVAELRAYHTGTPIVVEDDDRIPPADDPRDRLPPLLTGSDDPRDRLPPRDEEETDDPRDRLPPLLTGTSGSSGSVDDSGESPSPAAPTIEEDEDGTPPAGDPRNRPPAVEENDDDVPPTGDPRNRPPPLP